MDVKIKRPSGVTKLSVAPELKRAQVLVKRLDIFFVKGMISVVRDVFSVIGRCKFLLRNWHGIISEDIFLLRLPVRES